MMVRQNKWRACRYGMAANLVDPYTQKPLPAREIVLQLVAHLRETAEDLKCTDYLDHVIAMAEKPTGAERQISLFEDKENPAEVVRELVGAV
jgi:carboxylate-amine ligase